MDYDYKEIAKIINRKFSEREIRLQERSDSKFDHGFGWASDLNKCLLVCEDLKNQKELNKYQKWFLEEIEFIKPCVKYLDNFVKWIQLGAEGKNFVEQKIGQQFNSDNLDHFAELDKWFESKGNKVEIEFVKTIDFNDEYGIRICLCSAAIAYCAQFSLGEFEIFYNIYKEILNLNKLNILTPL